MGEHWSRFWQSMAVITASCAAIVVAAVFPTSTLPAVDLLRWLEDHEKLSGWAQFVGAMGALFVTGWFARHEVRSSRRREADRVKHLLLLTLLVVRGVRDVRAADSGGHLKVTAGVRKESLDYLEPMLARLGDHLTSSFMVNNYSALMAHTRTLKDAYSNISEGAKDEVEFLRAREIGLDAISNNLAREVRRLGGKYESHDDLQLAGLIPMTLSARIKHWRRSRQSKAS